MQDRFLVNRERGSATVTALIVVGVAAVLLAGLMWRQQIQIRTLESARDRIQAEWLQRAAIDFARLVLVEDQRTSQYDHLGEAWALPLADGKVADFLKNTDVPDEIAAVSLQGQLIDAQSRFNLSNLWDKGFKTINPAGVQEYGRLLETLGLDKGLAQQTAQGILQTDMPVYDLEGLLRLTYYNSDILEKIRSFVVVLPTLTSVNVNTAPPEVLMAAIPGLSRSAAGAFVQLRATAPIKSVDEITGLLNKLGSAQGITIDASLVDVRSQYWLARSEIRMGRGIFANSALIQRSQNPLSSGNFTQVIWSKTGKMAVE
ncbi:type II secretion system minor pseudopilin GspK [Polynucleobacter arcticus]|uniref:type II secretion system minor pseudopilin GspK n=2 Tax=Polynucleobacter arcticus TaxID=1743165 RepID=UPI0039F12246